MFTGRSEMVSNDCTPAVLYSVWRYYVQPITRSAVPADITADHPLYRFSALLCLVMYYTRLSYVLYL
jgi:hypothetical protein